MPPGPIATISVTTQNAAGGGVVFPEVDLLHERATMIRSTNFGVVVVAAIVDYTRANQLGDSFSI